MSRKLNKSNSSYSLRGIKLTDSDSASTFNESDSSTLFSKENTPVSGDISKPFPTIQEISGSKEALGSMADMF